MTHEEMEQAAATLEAFQKWRTGEDDRTMAEAGIVAGEVTKAIDTLINAVENLKISDDELSVVAVDKAGLDDWDSLSHRHCWICGFKSGASYILTK